MDKPVTIPHWFIENMNICSKWINDGNNCCTILAFDAKENIAKVRIRTETSEWTEDNWNLAHIIVALKNGEYSRMGERKLPWVKWVSPEEKAVKSELSVEKIEEILEDLVDSRSAEPKNYHYMNGKFYDPEDPSSWSQEQRDAMTDLYESARPQMVDFDCDGPRLIYGTAGETDPMFEKQAIGRLNRRPQISGIASTFWCPRVSDYTRSKLLKHVLRCWTVKVFFAMYTSGKQKLKNITKKKVRTKSSRTFRRGVMKPQKRIDRIRFNLSARPIGYLHFVYKCPKHHYYPNDPFREDGTLPELECDMCGKLKEYDKMFFDNLAAELKRAGYKTSKHIQA